MFIIFAAIAYEVNIKLIMIIVSMNSGDLPRVVLFNMEKNDRSTTKADNHIAEKKVHLSISPAIFSKFIHPLPNMFPSS